MTTWDKIVARLVEGIEKLAGFMAGLWARIENKGRHVSLLTQRREKRKELERAYARLGRIMEERTPGDNSDEQADPAVHEARQAVADLRRELEDLERCMRGHA